MPRKFIYLINPISGVRGKDEILEAIKQEHRRRNLPYEILPTNAEGDYRFIEEKVNQEAVTDLIVCGGDGSVNKVAASLMGVDINIGIVPMGSGNGLARTAGISPQPAKALATIFEGTPEFIDGFYINEHFSCMLCGIGFDAQVAHEFAKQSRRGLKTYIKVTATNFASAKPHRFTLHFDSESVSIDAFFISIANSNQFGNNFTIAPKASLTDGLLDIVIVKSMSKFILPFAIIRQVAGINTLQVLSGSIEEKNVMYFQTSSIKIENHDDALFHIDGDPMETAAQFNIRLIPKAFKLIMPVKGKSNLTVA